MYTVWYVAVDGDDSNSCLTPEEACATINAAVEKASDFDRVEVGPGTYDEEYVRWYHDYPYTTRGVQINKHLTIAGAGVDSTIIRYVGVVGPGVEEIGGVTLRDLTVAGDEVGGVFNIEIDGRGSTRGLPGILVENRAILRLENSTVRDVSSGNGISVFGSRIRLLSTTLSNAPIWLHRNSSAVVENSAFSESLIVAVSGATSLTIRDSTLSQRGISSSAETVTLENVVISGGGIGVEIREGEATISNSQIGNHGYGGIVAHGGAHIHLVNTIVENSARVGIWIYTGGAMDIEDSSIIK